MYDQETERKGRRLTRFQERSIHEILSGYRHSQREVRRGPFRGRDPQTIDRAILLPAHAGGARFARRGGEKASRRGSDGRDGIHLRLPPARREVLQGRGLRRDRHQPHHLEGPQKEPAEDEDRQRGLP